MLFGHAGALGDPDSRFHFSDLRLIPHYPAKSPLEDVLRLVPPGTDEYVSEKYAVEIEAQLHQWGIGLRRSVHDHSTLANLLDVAIEATSLAAAKDTTLRAGYGIEVV
jgi:hypothetical protein